VQSKKFEHVLNPDWDIDGASISFDGNFLAVITNEDGYNKLSLHASDSLKEIPLNGLPETGIVYSARFSKDSKYMALSVGDSRHTTDIWLYSIDNQTCWQLTQSPQGVPPEELVEPELFRFTSFDGLSVPAFLYMPRKIKEGEKVPVIVHIHGGPEAQYQPSLVLLIQYFVYQGYAVIAPNVRGSTGYGKKYVALDDIEKRLDSVRDLASLHEHIKTIPQLNSEKVALMGGSYGGFMTLAGLVFYPDLWVGGVDIVGISNFITFLENTAPYRRILREAEYGFLDKHRDLLYSISPINHIDKIKSPLFIIHGANDPRVPLNEAEQIVEKLTSLGRKAELLVYHDEGHGLSKLKNRLDAYPKVSEFFRKIFS
jgi:dipeptidyl aminopeptidase/acylaminoacyl peptidase